MVITFSILINDKTVPLISILLIDKISNIPFKISLAPSPHFFLSSKSWANQANWTGRKRKVGIIFLVFKCRISVRSHIYICLLCLLFKWALITLAIAPFYHTLLFLFLKVLRDLTKLKNITKKTSCHKYVYRRKLWKRFILQD